MKFSILNTTKTNNFHDPEIQTKIMGLWEESGETIQRALKEGKVAACIYHDYASNYKGDYLVSIAIEDSRSGAFDTSVYQWKEYPVDESDKLGVLKTWEKIWEEEEQHLIKRVYAFDFESYRPDGRVAIHVAIQGAAPEEF